VSDQLEGQGGLFEEMVDGVQVVASYDRGRGWSVRIHLHRPFSVWELVGLYAHLTADEAADVLLLELVAAMRLEDQR